MDNIEVSIYVKSQKMFVQFIRCDVKTKGDEIAKIKRIKTESLTFFANNHLKYVFDYCLQLLLICR